MPGLLFPLVILLAVILISHDELKRYAPVRLHTFCLTYLPGSGTPTDQSFTESVSLLTSER